MQASKHARYLGLVDPAAIIDRKNPQTRVYSAPSEGEQPTIEVMSQGLEMGVPAFPALPSYLLLGYAGTQRYHLEVCCEKTSMDDIVLPICQRYGANYQAGGGRTERNGGLSPGAPDTGSG